MTLPRPRCPHPPQEFFPYFEAPLPESYPALEIPRDDELECLHLTLTIPKASLDRPSRKTPVLVFVHGGAFVGGNSASQVSGREMFDGADVVRHSMQLKKDIIGLQSTTELARFGFWLPSSWPSITRSMARTLVTTDCMINDALSSGRLTLWGALVAIQITLQSMEQVRVALLAIICPLFRTAGTNVLFSQAAHSSASVPFPWSTNKSDLIY